MKIRRTTFAGSDALPRRATAAGTAGLRRLRQTLEGALVARLSDDATVVEVDGAPLPSPWRERVERRRDATRLVFNAVSRGYLAATGTPCWQRCVASSRALDLEGVRKFASVAGFTVASVVPYGALLAHPTGGRSLLAPLDLAHRWRRAMSWLARDDDLLALVCFLEERLVSALPPSLAPYLMVVLETPTEGSPPDDRVCHDTALRAASLTDLAQALDLPLASIRTQLDPLLEPLKSRLLLFALLGHVDDRRPGLHAAGLLTSQRAKQYAGWRRAHQLDRDVAQFSRQWAQGVPQRRVQGVDATLAVDYRLIRLMLEDYHDLFDSVQR